MNLKTSRERITLQHRDTTLVRILVEEFPILTREQIGELFPMGSVTRLNFRLKQLRDAGYLSVRSLDGFGAASKYGYYLGPRAIELFENPTEQQTATTIRARARQLAQSGLAHRLLVNSIHIRFLTARRSYPNYRLTTWFDQYSPLWEDLRRSGVPVQADGYGEYLMLLHFDNLFGFFLEVDRGTERGQVIQEKIDRYIRYAESGDYERQFAAGPVRVLFITTSKERLKGLVKMIEAQTDKIFWITTWEQFNQAKLFDAYWVRPQREGMDSLLSHQ